MEQKNMQCELIEIEGSFNVRELGGYQGLGGKVLRSRRFIRSGSLGKVTPKGLEQLKKLQIGCVVDLRSSREAEILPDVTVGDSTIGHCHLPMLDYIQSNIASGDFSTFPKSMAEMYVGILDNSQDRLREAFAIFADPAHKCVLFHCTAGKDRTGVLAMLLLLMAGVSEADVVEDYSWSDKLETPLLPPKDGKLPAYLFESKPETMEETIDHLAQVYGGVGGYLHKIGVTAIEQEAVLHKLFDA